MLGSDCMVREKAKMRYMRSGHPMDRNLVNARVVPRGLQSVQTALFLEAILVRDLCSRLPSNMLSFGWNIVCCLLRIGIVPRWHTRELSVREGKSR